MPSVGSSMTTTTTGTTTPIQGHSQYTAHYASISHVGIQHYPHLTCEYWSDSLLISRQTPQTSAYAAGLVAASSSAWKYAMQVFRLTPWKLRMEGRGRMKFFEDKFIR